MSCPEKEIIKRVTVNMTKAKKNLVGDTYSNIGLVIKSISLKWARHVALMWERRGAQWILVGKPEGKRPNGRPTCRWVDNTKINLHEFGLGKAWNELIWLRTGTGGGLQWKRVPPNAGILRLTEDFSGHTLGFPVPKSKCWDGSQDSRLPLHASHVALPT